MVIPRQIFVKTTFKKNLILKPLVYYVKIVLQYKDL